MPDRLAGKAPSEIERLEVFKGNRKTRLADLFQVAGDASDQHVEFEGDLSGVHGIGLGMASGEIQVRGNAGRHLGAGMKGGRIQVDGNAGDHAGCEMQGGAILIEGTAGDRLGASYPGSKRGMTGGTIIVRGDAGSEAGASMRRGTLAVGGACGDAPGFNMIAGSILIFGSCGPRPGAGMRRGTIGLFGHEPTRLLPTFRHAGRFRPLFLRLFLRSLTEMGLAVDRGLYESELSLAHGDLLALGKGEIWMKDH